MIAIDTIFFNNVTEIVILTSVSNIKQGAPIHETNLIISSSFKLLSNLFHINPMEIIMNMGNIMGIRFIKVFIIKLFIFFEDSNI